jgi:hypothetical protein
MGLSDTPLPTTGDVEKQEGAVENNPVSGPVTGGAEGRHVKRCVPSFCSLSWRVCWQLGGNRALKARHLQVLSHFILFLSRFEGTLTVLRVATME